MGRLKRLSTGVVCIPTLLNDCIPHDRFDEGQIFRIAHRMIGAIDAIGAIACAVG